MDYKKLTHDLIRSKLEAYKYMFVEDNGTCNLDTCILYVKNAVFSKIEEAVKEAGLLVSKWGSGCYHIYGYTSGQANRRTTMVEVFEKTLRDLGWDTGVYYMAD